MPTRVLSKDTAIAMPTVALETQAPIFPRVLRAFSLISSTKTLEIA